MLEGAGRLPDLTQLVVPGPLRAQRLDFEDPASQGAALIGGFVAFLAEPG